jgi:hypothetical protein
LSELTGNRIRTTAAKLGLPHLAETITQPATQRPPLRALWLNVFTDL